jgi:hypothetical protein
MSYKYPINYQFTVEKNKKTYHGTIIKYAAMDEFGADFYALENNYVVKFDVDHIPIATYNFIESIETIAKSVKYNYVMTENDIH